MAESLFFVFSNAVDGKDDEFNDWYDGTHIPDVLKVPGVSAAQRYSLSPIEMPESDEGPVPPPAHRYLAVYTVDGEPQAVMGDFLGRVGSGEMELSPTLDLTTVSMGFWTAHGPRRTAK
ncbi:MAG TPA: hypothetical protein VHC41_00725 [Mycobacteriales bacterium]|nr:hypothetical protein [Mycobacteriales bacterium]